MIGTAAPDVNPGGSFLSSRSASHELAETYI
jgi:hypothetical protein